MGKSSLRVRTMQRLQDEGIACAFIDITAIGGQGVTIDKWYAGVLRSLVAGLNLGQRVNLRSWLRERDHLPPIQWLGEFVQEVLLAELPPPIVIFIDEIDSVISLPFPIDDFFAWIRSCYNDRVDKPQYKRLTFVLLGVATPSDLIRDKTRTPFNIGRAIELCGFETEEAKPLLLGLSDRLGQSQSVLQTILHWTRGQPFLTQKLCRLVATAGRDGDRLPLSPEAVEQLIQERLIRQWESQDEPEHLRTIRERLLRNEQQAGRLLGLYQQILQQGDMAAEDSRDLMELRLSGLVVKQQGRLRVYNPIYAAVFNLEWVESCLAQLRPYAAAITAWIASGCQDDSRLLRGEALAEAQQWAGDKNLSPQDYRFLTASQELANRAAEQARQEAEQARQLLAAANQTLEAANQQATQRIQTANQRLRIGSTVLVGTIVLASITGVSLLGARAERDQIQQQVEQSQTDLKEAEAARQEAEQDRSQARQEVEQANAKIAEADRRIEDANQQVETARSQANQARVQQAQAQRATDSATRQQQAAEAKTAEAEAATLTAQQQQQYAQTGTELERRGTALLRFEPERFRELEVLLDAVKLGRELQDLIATNPDANQDLLLANYPAVSPVLALRTAVNTVSEQNRIPGEFLAWSEDGQRLVAYSDADDTNRIYDLSGTELGQFPGAFRAWSEDGRQLLASIFDEDISRLYDWSGNVIAEFTGITYFQGDKPLLSSSLGFSPDGQRIMTISNDGYVRIWRLDNGLADLLTQGCAWLQDYLNSDNPEVTDADRALCHLPPRASVQH